MQFSDVTRILKRTCQKIFYNIASIHTLTTMTDKLKQTYTEEELSQFEWIKLHNEMSANDETMKEKFIRKFSENPFIPIGCLATTGALSYGLWSFRQGNKKMSQYMMRTRILAQGFTVIALVIGIGMGASKATSK